MARITKEIKELIKKYYNHSSNAGYHAAEATELYHNLKTAGMTEKQLQDRGIHEDAHDAL